MLLFLSEIIGGFVLSSLLLWVYHKRGPSALWVCAFAVSVVLTRIFYLQWERQLIKEDPWIANVLAGLVPPLAVAGLVVALHRRVPPVLIPIFGSLVYFVVYAASALIGMYVLGDLI
jgi:hypothetical protein